MAFDVLWLNGADLRSWLLGERRRRLERILPKRSSVISEALSVEGRGRALFELMRSHDLEGIVAKRLDDPYTPASNGSRSRTLTTRKKRAERSCSIDNKQMGRLFVRTQIDYDACYRLLELEPGASLTDVEERGKFLRAAFHPDRFHEHFQKAASEKLKNINVSIDALRSYWKTFGTAPPTNGAQPPPPPPQPEPKPQPKPEPQREPPPHTDRGNGASGSPAFDHANHLAINAGYRGNGAYRERLLDSQWWKFLWSMLDLPYGKMGRHEVAVHGDRIIVQTYAYQWEQLMCVMQLSAGVKLDDYFKQFFDRGKLWRDPAVGVVSYSAPQKSKQPPPNSSSTQSQTTGSRLRARDRDGRRSRR